MDQVLDMDNLDKSKKLRVLAILKGNPTEFLVNHNQDRYLYLQHTTDGYYLIAINSLNDIRDPYKIVDLVGFIQNYNKVFTHKMENEILSMKRLTDLLIEDN